MGSARGIRLTQKCDELCTHLYKSDIPGLIVPSLMQCCNLVSVVLSPGLTDLPRNTALEEIKPIFPFNATADGSQSVGET